MKNKDKNKYMINNYNELLSFFLEKNKITISDEFILNMMFFSKENNDIRFIMKELSPIVKIMVDIITNEDTTQDLKDILSIMLKNKIHNDIILWGIIYSSLNIEEVYNHAGTLFIIPNNIRLALKSYMESEDE